MVSCDKWNMGCNGGILSWAWSYLTKTGVVSETCEPYLSGDGSTQQCAKKCAAEEEEFHKFKCTSGSVVEAKGVDQIKAEIAQNGPVETGFTVYEDFMNYKSGVYHYTTGKQLGGHAVKIVGWGEDHWIVANSWNTTWGEKGFFRIAFKECGIDAAAYGCKPQL
jgi:cathepsin B